MSGATIFLICIVTVPVLVLIVWAVYGKISYKRQVEGKKTPRKLSEYKIARLKEKSEPTSPDIEMLQNEARLKSGQNLFGPM